MGSGQSQERGSTVPQVAESMALWDQVRAIENIPKVMSTQRQRKYHLKMHTTMNNQPLPATLEIHTNFDDMHGSDHVARVYLTVPIIYGVLSPDAFVCPANLLRLDATLDWSHVSGSNLSAFIRMMGAASAGLMQGEGVYFDNKGLAPEHVAAGIAVINEGLWRMARVLQDLADAEMAKRQFVVAVHIAINSGEKTVQARQIVAQARTSNTGRTPDHFPLADLVNKAWDADYRHDLSVAPMADLTFDGVVRRVQWVFNTGRMVVPGVPLMLTVDAEWIVKSSWDATVVGPWNMEVSVHLPRDTPQYSEHLGLLNLASFHVNILRQWGRAVITIDKVVDALVDTALIRRAAADPLVASARAAMQGMAETAVCASLAIVEKRTHALLNPPKDYVEIDINSCIRGQTVDLALMPWGATMASIRNHFRKNQRLLDLLSPFSEPSQITEEARTELNRYWEASEWVARFQHSGFVVRAQSPKLLMRAPLHEVLWSCETRVWRA